MLTNRDYGSNIRIAFINGDFKELYGYLVVTQYSVAVLNNAEQLRFVGNLAQIMSIETDADEFVEPEMAVSADSDNVVRLN